MAHAFVIWLINHEIRSFGFINATFSLNDKIHPIPDESRGSHGITDMR